MNKRTCTKRGHLCKHFEFYKEGATMICDVCSRKYKDFFEKKDSNFPKCSKCGSNDSVGLEFGTKDKYFCIKCGLYINENKSVEK